ncbi:2-oxoglutarate and iron-dependent oxygenase domain-containing protein 3-like protein [Leptotrombidium deliense]|uniref:2-oxoglutarate and iron-dependent oxygenase domain-containing protein 3-like protein n=1 Tax=Leptotrombidium deliense TaxID=299467 RepID=A0A443SR33_9ACAR|nr:2-oxoglutarate and iron-dependent oxygenase domain-containing protein 3-like protein [Leptotrombidium deliense]
MSSSLNASRVQRNARKNNCNNIAAVQSAVSNGKFSDKNAEKSSSYSQVIALTIVVGCLYYIAISDEYIVSNADQLIRYLANKANVTFNYVPKAKYLATIDQHFPGISMHQVNCSSDGYKEEAKLGVPPLRCGTIISDTVVTVQEAVRLREMAAKLTYYLGTSSAKERESLNLKWVELYNVFRRGPPEGVLTRKEYELLLKTSESAKQNKIEERIETRIIAKINNCHAVSVMFGIPADSLYFSHISEFTRYKPMIKFSEFLHIDKIRAPNLVITAIVWLSTIDSDFLGGHLEFLTGGPEPFTPVLIEPKLGRFAAWTSSYENPHGVKEVYKGERLALVLGFTVFPKSGHKTLEEMFDVAIANYETV